MGFRSRLRVMPRVEAVLTPFVWDCHGYSIYAKRPGNRNLSCIVTPYSLLRRRRRYTGILAKFLSACSESSVVAIVEDGGVGSSLGKQRLRISTITRITLVANRKTHPAPTPLTPLSSALTRTGSLALSAPYRRILSLARVAPIYPDC
jgi:hypothetical protein